MCVDCPDDLMTMHLDLYYADEEQDKYGREVKTWIYDRTTRGYVEILGAVVEQALKAGQFFEYRDKLVGRTKIDPRISSDGSQHAITSMLITNIRDAKSDTEFYTESTGERSGKSTLYEVLAVEPYVNPWNEIEYYKILFNRSDRQVMIES
jgi:hypothetical protein